MFNFFNQLSDVTNKLTLSTRQTAALQAQLAQKTELLASHCEELREIKKEKRFTADNLSSAQEQTREKQGKIMSLQDRVCYEYIIFYLFLYCR